MARALLVLAAVVLSSTASGKSLEMPLPGALDLASGTPAEPGRGDLSISDGVIRAPMGIRVATSGTSQFQMMVPLMMDVSLICRATDGREFRVKVLADGGDRLMLEVLAPGESPRQTGPLQGAFILAAMAVDGLPTDMALPPLRLHPDGTYQLGSARGRFEQRPRWLVLDGHYQSWGQAEIAEGGEQLIFRFRRGRHVVQAVLQRVEEVPERALVATQ